MAYTEKRRITITTAGDGSGSGRFPDFSGKIVGFQMVQTNMVAGGSFAFSATLPVSSVLLPVTITAVTDTTFRDCIFPAVGADGTEDPAAKIQRSFAGEYVNVAITDGGASKVAYFDLFVEGTFSGS